MRTRGAIAVGLAALAAACRLGEPEPTPLRGPAPAVVAVWPHVAPAFAPVRATLLAGLDAALRERGYRIVTAPVAAEMLAAAGLGAGVDPAHAGPALGADAVLVCDVRAFAAAGRRPLQEADWDLAWRLVSTRGDGVLWEHRDTGVWSRPRDDGRPPGQPLDALPEVVAVGGGPITYRDAEDLLATLHRRALLALPREAR